MATTKTTNLVNIPILLEAMEAKFRGIKAFYGSAAVIQRNNLPSNGVDGGRIRQGKTIQIPYFDAMGEMEDIVNEGDALTPALLTETSETATVKHSGKAIEITEFAQLFGSGGGDPYAEAARQFAELTTRRMDKALLDAATASLAADYINDVYSAVTPVYLSWDTLVDSKLKWGDEQGDIVMLVVHSATYGRIMKDKDSTGRPLWVDNQDGSLPRYCGIPVKVSDRLPVDNSTPGKPKYDSRILKAGALALWMNGTPSLKEDEDVLADTNVLAVHVYYAAHRYLRTASGSHPGVVQIRHN